jgi:serine/threonine-protein kinase
MSGERSVSDEIDGGLPLPSVPGFRVERRVARGPLGTVYRARRGEEQAAIKIYPPSIAFPSAGRIAREHAAQQSVTHRSVARLLDWGPLDDGSAFLASEWIEGERLEDRLARGPMEWRELHPILASIADGLAAIHRTGLIHRDLKPANIMLPTSGQPAAVLIDFGHSLILSDERLTDRGLVLGSASYMAPEQAAGEALDGRVDLYALGVVIYRALTGALPFTSKSPAEVLRKHQTEAVVPPRQRALSRDISAAAQDLCLWLLAKVPAARLPNAHVLAVTLRALAADRT